MLPVKLEIRIDISAAEPPYDQIKHQITQQVRGGELQPGDKLPTVRRLADELGLAPNTVARAYRELESAGLLDTRGRAGSFISGDQTNREARRAATEYAERSRALGLSPGEALSLIKRALGVA